ncbi:MAG: hypothetical protein EBR09_11475 [Proteobacteria bacterium]|nr:hypothetical protein [Pseudomonadota bacterium]
MNSTIRLLSAIGLMAAALGAAGCGKKKTSSNGLAEGASITISGQLAISDSSTTASSLNLADFEIEQASNLSPQDLKVYCVSFAFPPKAGTGSVDANGAFSLNIEANDVAVGCFILNGTDTVASMVFEDKTGTNVDGASKSDSRLAFSGNTNMGTISVDTATGKAKADVSAFKSKTKTFAGNGFDFTGTWKIKASDNLPTGYKTAQAASSCPNMNQGGGGGSGGGSGSGPMTPEQIALKEACNGPKIDEKIYFQRIAGKKTTDNSDAFALAVWKSKASFEACESKIGFDIALAKTKIGVDFTSSGIADGAFVWSQGWEYGWKYTQAASQYDRPKCKPEKITLPDGKLVEFMKCKGKFANNPSVPVYRIDLNTRDSGCRDSSNNPVQIRDWNNVTWSGTPICEDKFNGVVKSCTSKGTYNGSEITCKNTGGFVSETNSAVVKPSGVEFQMEWQTAGQCSAIADEVQKLQCYADYYFQNRDDKEDKCIADVSLNPGATTAADFVVTGNGPTRAKNQYAMNLMNYTSATTASVHDEKTYFRGISSGSKDGGQSFVNCKFAESVDLALTKLSDTEVLFDLIMSKKSVDMNPICNSMSGKDSGMVQKFLFKATKE